jgi:hypothetical protein
VPLTTEVAVEEVAFVSVCPCAQLARLHVVGEEVAERQTVRRRDAAFAQPCE